MNLNTIIMPFLTSLDVYAFVNIVSHLPNTTAIRKFKILHLHMDIWLQTTILYNTIHDNIPVKLIKNENP